MINPLREAIWVSGKLEQLEYELQNSEYKEVNLISKNLKDKFKSWANREIITSDKCLELDLLLDYLQTDGKAGYLDKQAGYKSIDKVREEFNDEVLEMILEYIKEEVKEE